MGRKKGNPNWQCHKFNDYSIDDKDSSTMFGVTSNTGVKFYFDSEDYDKIKDYCWREDDKGYVKAGIKLDGRHVKIHQLIIGKIDGLVIDHIDRNPLNNKKSNLRHVTQKWNITNKAIQSNNTSGISGVSKTKRGRWHVRLYENNIRIYLDWR